MIKCNLCGKKMPCDCKREKPKSTAKSTKSSKPKTENETK